MTADDRMRVGFIGLGNQGAPIAERVGAAGFPLTVWARRAEASAPFARKGHAVAATPKDLGMASDLVCICVTDDAATEEVASNVGAGMAEGTVLAIMSTVSPQTCRRIAEAVARRHVNLVDAPVSGGADRARAGTLTVMVGGRDVVVDRCRPVFASFAGLVVRLGDVGSGQLAKLLNNAMMAANLAIAHEAARLARLLGVDVGRLHQVIAASSGQSFSHSVYAQMADSSLFGHGARLLRKDLDILTKLAEEAGDTTEHLAREAYAFIDSVEKGGQKPD